MLVRRFKFRRNGDKHGFHWMAESEVEAPRCYRGFTAVGKTLANVKEFAALVQLVRANWCAGTLVGNAPTTSRTDHRVSEVRGAQSPIAGCIRSCVGQKRGCFGRGSCLHRARRNLEGAQTPGMVVQIRGKDQLIRSSLLQQVV